MALITLTRKEWAAIVDELDGAYCDDALPGLRERIAALLADTPSAWPDQACKLELADLAAVDLIHAIVRQWQKHPVDPAFVWQDQASVAEAEKIIRNHQLRGGEG